MLVKRTVVVGATVSSRTNSIGKFHIVSLGNSARMIFSEGTMNEGIATQPGLVKATEAPNKRAMYRVALLGSGYIADWHAKALASIRNVRLVAACDQKLDRARALAEKFDVPRVYSSLED